MMDDTIFECGCPMCDDTEDDTAFEPGDLTLTPEELASLAEDVKDCYDWIPGPWTLGDGGVIKLEAETVAAILADPEALWWFEREQERGTFFDPSALNGDPV